MEIRNLTTTP